MHKSLITIPQLNQILINCFSLILQLLVFIYLLIESIDSYNCTMRVLTHIRRRIFTFHVSFNICNTIVSEWVEAHSLYPLDICWRILFYNTRMKLNACVWHDCWPGYNHIGERTHTHMTWHMYVCVFVHGNRDNIIVFHI